MRICIQVVFLFITACFLVSCYQNNDRSRKATAVFQVDYPSPTADKPQSKLWFMDNCWWAILPKSNGPSLWQRTKEGWNEVQEVHNNLKGIPGRVDLWFEDNIVTAVGVSEDSLAVFRVTYKKQYWENSILGFLYPPDNGKIETATITRDGAGRFWIAADNGKHICVWSTCDDGKNWEGPLIISDRVDEDDISIVTRVPEGVAVIWSNQLEDAVATRIHKNFEPFGKWEETKIIESGNNIADDHLNTVLSSEGTLWLTSKNSIDHVGEPQFILRTRTSDGTWSSYPYGDLDPALHPSRPAIFLIENNESMVLTGHTVYNQTNPYLGEIAFGVVDTTNRSNILRRLTPVIVPDTTNWIGQNRINDITGPKHPFPNDAPWIVLASDREGRIYEADLASYFN